MFVFVFGLGCFCIFSGRMFGVELLEYKYYFKFIGINFQLIENEKRIFLSGYLIRNIEEVVYINEMVKWFVIEDKGFNILEVGINIQ